jgi:hypothetical protein
MSQKRHKQIRKAAKMVAAKTGDSERKLVKIGKKAVRNERN